MRVLIRNFAKKNPKRNQDPVFWAWPEFFSPLRGTTTETTTYLLSYFFQLSYTLKVPPKLQLWTFWG